MLAALVSTNVSTPIDPAFYATQFDRLAPLTGDNHALPYLGLAFGVVLLRQTFGQATQELDEVARLAGAGLLATISAPPGLDLPTPVSQHDIDGETVII